MTSVKSPSLEDSQIVPYFAQNHFSPLPTNSRGLIPCLVILCHLASNCTILESVARQPTIAPCLLIE